MKKNLLFVLSAFVAVLFLASCKTTSSHYVNRVNLDGNYVLQNVQLNGLPTDAKYNVTLLNDVSADCFIGSDWVLPHNGNGSYTISKGDCYSGKRNINWSVRTSGGKSVMQMKVMDGRKAKEITDGYIMDIVSATADGFVLESPVSVEGNTGTIVYTFARR